MMQASREWFLNQMNLVQYDLKINNEPHFWIILDKSIDVSDPFFEDIIFSLALEAQQVHFVSLLELAESKVGTNSFLWFVNCQLALNLNSVFQHYVQFTTKNLEALKKQAELKKAFWQVLNDWIKMR